MSPWRLLTPAELAGGERSSITIGPFGSNLRTVDYRDSGVPLVFVRDIRRSDFTQPSHYVSKEKAVELRSHVALPGDVLITKMGEPPGDAAVYNGNGPAVITADCIRLRPTTEFDAKFVALALDAPAVRAQMELITNGVAQRKVSLARFRVGIRIPVPELAEQRRIVEILEGHLSHLDAAEGYVDQAAARGTRLLDAAILDEFARYPAERTSLGNIAQIKNGIFVSRAKSEPNGVPILRIGAVRSLALDLTDLRYSGRAESDLTREDGLLKADDVLFTRYNGNPEYVGVAAVVPSGAGPLTYPDKLIRARINSEFAVPQYVALACAVGDTRNQIRSFVKTTAGQAGISGRDLRSVAIQLPALGAQQQVVERVRSWQDGVAMLTDSARKAGKRSAALRRSLLAAAFSGRLTGRSSDSEVIEGLASREPTADSSATA